jgi:hypothetical protein
MNKFPNLADDMKRLLESGMHSDMEIVVEERIFKVHRIVLYLRRHLWDIEQDLATGKYFYFIRTLVFEANRRVGLFVCRTDCS